MERSISHLQKVREINCAITNRRNQFVEQYRNKRMGAKVLHYEPALDSGVYKVLQTYQDTGTAYTHVKNELNAYTSWQVETFIGERLNAGLSEYRYDVKNGALYGQGMSDSLLDMIKRGRDCRDTIVNDVDKPRQDAEIVQFERIQKEFTQPDQNGNLPEVGKTIVSMSPRGGEGSAYGKNFDDIFVLSEDPQKKERFVAARRFASGLSLAEREAIAKELQPDYFAQYASGPLDSYFLSHPLIISSHSSLSGDPEAIHSFLHTGHEFLSTENFTEVKRAIAGLIMSYVNTLCETPDNEALLKLTLNAVMNKADHVADNLRRPQHGMETHLHEKMHNNEPIGPASFAEIHKLGIQKVRVVATGCGESSGFGQEDNRASNMVTTFSMRDFGTDKLGNRTFNCPDCGEMNVRPVNELVNNCQNCGSDKVSC